VAASTEKSLRSRALQEALFYPAQKCTIPPGAVPDHVESLNFKEVEHALIEKVEQLFRDMLQATGLKQISLGIAYGLR
jgi:hypothetical protein